MNEAERNLSVRVSPFVSRNLGTVAFLVAVPVWLVLVDDSSWTGVIWSALIPVSAIVAAGCAWPTTRSTRIRMLKFATAFVAACLYFVSVTVVVWTLIREIESGDPEPVGPIPPETITVPVGMAATACALFFAGALIYLGSVIETPDPE